MAVDTTTATPSGFDVFPPVIASGGGGGTVSSVTAADETIVIGGTTADPTVRANTTKSATASEDLVAGNFVAIWNNAGTPSVRKADASLGQGYQADGYVVSSASLGATVTVYTSGINNHVSGLTAGDVWLGTAGAATNTPPTTVGYISQQIGVALTSTSVGFEPQPDVLIAATHDVTTGGSSQSTVVTTTTNITINSAVGAGFLTMSGGGAGGSPTSNATPSGGKGGGAAEYCQNLMVPLTPGETVTVTIGAGGTSGNDGGTTSFACAAGTFSVLGGKTAGTGGGPRGAAAGATGGPGASGALGTAESPCHFGGSSGGGGGNAVSVNGGAGGGGPGNLVGGAAGAGNTHGGGGGGGGASPWGVGGAGGAGNGGGSNAPAGSYGAGGGGAGGNDATGQAGGTGQPGYVLLMYVA